MGAISIAKKIGKSLFSEKKGYDDLHKMIKKKKNVKRKTDVKDKETIKEDESSDGLEKALRASVGVGGTGAAIAAGQGVFGENGLVDQAKRNKEIKERKKYRKNKD